MTIKLSIWTCPIRAMPEFPVVEVRGILGVDRGYGFEFPEDFVLTSEEVREIGEQLRHIGRERPKS